MALLAASPPDAFAGAGDAGDTILFGEEVLIGQRLIGTFDIGQRTQAETACTFIQIGGRVITVRDAAVAYKTGTVLCGQRVPDHCDFG
jgi:hypothetical protein